MVRGRLSRPLADAKWRLLRTAFMSVFPQGGWAKPLRPADGEDCDRGRQNANGIAIALIEKECVPPVRGFATCWYDDGSQTRPGIFNTSLRLT